MQKQFEECKKCKYSPYCDKYLFTQGCKLNLVVKSFMLKIYRALKINKLINFLKNLIVK